MFNLRGEMKKRTDQIIKCVEDVRPDIKDLTDKLDELIGEIKKNNVDPRTLKTLEKIARSVSSDFSKMDRAFEAHGKIMEKVSEELKS